MARDSPYQGQLREISLLDAIAEISMVEAMERIGAAPLDLERHERRVNVPSSRHARKRPVEYAA